MCEISWWVCLSWDTGLESWITDMRNINHLMDTRVVGLSPCRHHCSFEICWIYSYLCSSPALLGEQSFGQSFRKKSQEKFRTPELFRLCMFKPFVYYLYKHIEYLFFKKTFIAGMSTSFCYLTAFITLPSCFPGTIYRVSTYICWIYRPHSYCNIILILNKKIHHWLMGIWCFLKLLSV